MASPSSIAVPFDRRRDRSGDVPVDFGCKGFQFSSDLVHLEDELAVFTARQSAGARTKLRCLAAEI